MVPSLKRLGSIFHRTQHSACGCVLVRANACRLSTEGTAQSSPEATFYLLVSRAR